MPNFRKKNKRKLRSKRFLRKSRRVKQTSKKGMRGGSLSTFVVYGRMSCPYTREALEILTNKNKID